LKGGSGEKIIPQYIEPRNNPSIPVEQKQIYAERFGEQTQQAERQRQQQQEKQILNLQVYQPQKPKPEKPIEGMPLYPTFTANPYFPAQMSNVFNPFAMGMLGTTYPAAVNVNKIYEINASGPTGPHTKLNMIYEDILPGKGVLNTFKTVGERISQSQYVRTILFYQGDGTEVDLDGSTANSLLSHIKFLELNPFNTNKFSNNPYKGLPDGYLIYRTCYPIKRSEPFGQPTCARDSMAINVRIYKLTSGAYLINKQNNNKLHEFEQWREVTYYEYIRDNIIKKKVCPNFVSIFGYYLCRRSNICFDKINQVNLSELKGTQDINFANLNIQGPENEQTKMTNALVKNLRELNPGNIIQQLDTELKLKNMQIKQKQVKLDEYNGEVLVTLTESPTYNLFSWASKIYQQEGNTRRMINTGYHNEKVWRSIIFQLMVGLYVLHINKIYIKDFNIQNNVFIKDLNIEGTATTYWRYKINGIDYYVPNYGYIVLIDSNYRDYDTQKPSPTQQKKYKLDGQIFSTENTINGTEEQKTYEMFKAGLDTNNFDTNFANIGGVKPDGKILDTLDKIHADTDKNLESYFIKYMTKYMNNRIGTYLKEQETVHVRSDDLRQFSRGQMLVYEEGADIYKFVLYLDVNNGIATILTKDKTSQNDPQINKEDEEIIQKQVQITTLFNYSLTEPIVQNFNMNESNPTEENILETYNIN